MRCSPRVAVPLALLTHISCRAPERMPADDSAAVPAATEGLVDADGGVQIFYRLVGSGPDTTIVIHGGPGLSMDYFADDLAPLAARHTLVFYDQRGTGRSSLVSDSVALDAQRFVDDLEALRRHFRLERVSLLGHSWGAAIVALYAMRFPERLERFVILGGVPTTRSELVTAFQQLEASRDTTELREMQQWRQARLSDPGDAAACRAYYVLWFRPFFVDSAAARRSKGDFCAGSPEARRNKIQAVDKYTMASLGDYDWRESLRAVRVPALIAHGSMDVLPAASARVWASMLPESRLLLFEGVGHFPYLEVPTEFFAAMDTFLRGVWPEGARAAAAP